MYNNINNVVALQMLLSFISIEEPTKAAMNGFAEDGLGTGKEKADLYYKILKVYFLG